MQQNRLRQIRRSAQVQHELTHHGFDLEPSRTCDSAQIRLQRYRRGVRGRGPQLLPDHQLVGDQSHHRVVAVAHHRLGRLAHFRKPRQWSPAQRRQTLGEPGGLDDVRRRDRDVFGAQQVCDLDQPPGDHVLMLREQVVVPTGRHHACAVAGGERQSRMRPRHPRQFHPDLGSAAEHFGIRCCGRQLPHQRRGVPRSADHRNLLHAWLFERFAQHLTHMRLASFLVQSFIKIAHRRKFIAQRGHGLGNGIKTRTIRACFDDVIPPSFRIVVPGRVGEHSDGIGPYGGTRVETTWFGQVEGEVIVRRLGLAPATTTAVGQHHRSR